MPPTGPQCVQKLLPKRPRDASFETPSAARAASHPQPRQGGGLCPNPLDNDSSGMDTYARRSCTWLLARSPMRTRRTFKMSAAEGTAPGAGFAAIGVPPGG
eukprot:6270434-Pyramimonas_sp.AAC.2